MVTLLVENQEVELDESVQFSINKYFEDTTNPTNIYSEWSKTVVIPRTIRNNQLFGSLYSPDRLIAYSSSDSNLGLYFDPYKRLDMRLERDGAIILKGYLKVLSINQEGYHCTLNGELGKIIQELKKLTFDTTLYTGEDSKYLIHGEDYYSEKMSNELIYNSWNTAKKSTTLFKKSDAGYVATNVIGYTPLNIRTDTNVFDQTTFQAADARATKFADVLDNLSNPTFSSVTLCDGSTAIGDGLKPRDIGEWRSYLQQPFIFFNQLVQIIGEKSKEITGYTFDYDIGWFNYSNPYWSDVVMTLDNFEESDNSFVTNNYTTRLVGATAIRWAVGSNYNTSRSSGLRFDSKDEVIPLLNEDNVTFNIDKKYANIGYSLTGSFTLWATNSYDGESLRDDTALIIGIYKNVGGTANQIHQVIVTSANSTKLNELKSLYPRATYIVNDFKRMSSNAYCDIPFTASYYSDDTDTDVTFSVSAVFYGSGGVYPLKKGESEASVITLMETANRNSPLEVQIYENYTRSGSTVTLNDLWDNTYNVFDMILNYCKMFRIGIFVDDISKKIKFIPYKTYFSKYTVTDWTDKVDKSNDFEIVPITFENKWVVFNYDKFESANNITYQKKYGVQFGEKKLDTHYIFNTNTNNLFSGIKPPVESSDNVLSWTNLYENRRIVYTLAAESFISPKDENDKLIDNFGTFYLDNGPTDFDPNENLRSNVITDDSQVQRSIGKYYYNQYLNQKDTTKYHKISPVYAQRIMTFALPAEQFSYISYKGKTDLFTELWSNYINERYNVQNKKVTCYIRLTQSDFMQFDFNHFILIDNQLYIVNKIFDYNPEELLTKVELITINNIQAYIN